MVRFFGPPCSNRGQCRLTTLIEANALTAIIRNKVKNFDYFVSLQPYNREQLKPAKWRRVELKMIKEAARTWLSRSWCWRTRCLRERRWPSVTKTATTPTTRFLPVTSSRFVPITTESLSNFPIETWYNKQNRPGATERILFSCRTNHKTRWLSVAITATNPRRTSPTCHNTKARVILFVSKQEMNFYISYVALAFWHLEGMWMCLESMWMYV